MRAIFTGLAAAILIAGCAMARTTTMATVTRTLSYAPVGLAVGETVQVNVTNLASATKSGTAASCTGTVTFFNATGTAIGAAPSFTTGSGQIASAKLPYASAAASGLRAPIRSVDTATGITYTTQNEPVDVTRPFAVFGRN